MDKYEKKKKLLASQGILPKRKMSEKMKDSPRNMEHLRKHTTADIMGKNSK